MGIKSTFVRARIEPTLKTEAEHVLDELGITPTEAIRMLYMNIVRQQAWPIELKIPNPETQKVFNDTDRGIGLNKTESEEDFFDQLDI